MMRNQVCERGWEIYLCEITALDLLHYIENTQFSPSLIVPTANYCARTLTSI